ncbi:Uncharacterized protein%2C possibly involved in aromatic compounds catabolism [Mycobacterium tuberculosis]|nr:Uncharacterized protein%2C possibly involved in aromatic compounds catabolism [Mycobacterium tuberculosis]
MESKIQYLYPARGELLEAQSHVLKKGKSLIIMEARVTCDGKLVACATGTYARVNNK